MNNAIAFIAERKIEEAIAEGALDNLPGMGRPIVLEDLSHLPDDLRMAYTMLKTGGYLDKAPKAGEPVSMKEMLRAIPDERQTYGKMQRLKVMLHKVRQAMPQGVRPADNLPEDSPYLPRLLDKA